MLLDGLFFVSGQLAVSAAGPANVINPTPTAGGSTADAWRSSLDASLPDLHSTDGARPFEHYAEPLNVSTSTTSSRTPAIAVTGNLVHIVWEEGSHIYHRLSQGGVWSSSQSVATGEQPAIVVDQAGLAHIVFVNEFGENYEVYYCRWNGDHWSLPRNVSNTSGVSSAPGIAVEPNGMLHVVWADNTPGYSVIYHGYWNGTYWLNEPVPHAMGGAPAIAVSANGNVDVAWQDRDAVDLPYEVYHSQWRGQSWSLPENLSDSASEQSLIPSVAMDHNDLAHVTWQERVDGRYAIYYTYGRVGYWSIPERVSENTVDAYLPTAAVRLPPQGSGATAGGVVYVGWDESTVAVYRSRDTGSGEWSQLSTVLSDPLGVADLQLAIDGSGLFHAVWSERVTVDNWEIFYQCLSTTVFLPVVLKHLSL